MELANQKCVPCEVKIPPLDEAGIAKLLPSLKTKWQVIEGKKLLQEFTFKDFHEAMQFVNKVAAIAEAEGHHPDLYMFYNKVKIELSTHFIGGLHQNDFIVASKIEKLHLYA